MYFRDEALRLSSEQQMVRLCDSMSIGLGPVSARLIFCRVWAAAMDGATLGRRASLLYPWILDTGLMIGMERLSGCPARFCARDARRQSVAIPVRRWLE